MQSKLEYRFDLLPADVMFILARILDYGAKRYEPNNWRKISVNDHINHALAHLFSYLNGDRQDDHIGHATIRCIMALACALQEGYVAQQGDERGSSNAAENGT